MKRSGPATRYKRSNWPKYSAAANVIGAAYKAYRGRGRTQTATKRKPQSGVNGITTFQKDVKQVYRYKRAPNYLRKRWGRSRRTFTSNLLKSEGSRKFHYHGSATWTTTAGNQAFFGWSTYGINGTGGYDGTGDLGDLYTRMDIELRQQGTLSDQNNRGEQARKWYFDHMRARCVLTNTGTSPIFWEIYECVARKDIELIPEGTSIATFQAYSEQLNKNGMLNNLAGGPGTADSAKQISPAVIPTNQVAGLTPFQFRHFCQAFKILKVTRLQAAPGHTVSFDASNPRNYTCVWDSMEDLLAKRGMTKFYMVRQWGAVTAEAPNNSASSAQFEIERDYNVKVLDSHLPQLNYFTYTG